LPTSPATAIKPIPFLVGEASYRAIIPLTTIDPGRYVLTVRAETGAAPGRPVSRQIPFTVR
jgi:hypothetical protein